MGKRFSPRFLAIGTVVVLLLGITLMGCGPTSPPNPVSAPAPSGSPLEGISVHGHWTMEVRNQDGVLVEFREFDNRLHPAGGSALASVLGRQASVGGWVIELTGSAFRAGMGMIMESTYGGGAPNIFKNLTVTAPGIADVTGGTPLQLRGTATAEIDGNITQAATQISKLSSSQPPSGNYSSTTAILTTATLSSPISLTAGQTLTVTITITFASP